MSKDKTDMSIRVRLLCWWRGHYPILDAGPFEARPEQQGFHCGRCGQPVSTVYIGNGTYEYKA